MIGLCLVLLATPRARAEAPASGLVPESDVFLAVDGGTGAAVDEQVVVGADGGVQALTIAARIRVSEDVVAGGALPWATFPVPGGRDRSLGNARLWSAWRLPGHTLRDYVGLAVHFDVGGPAYTWIDSAPELWPGAGIEAFWEARIPEGEVTWMLRGALGVHSAVRADPYDRRYLRSEIAGGVDVPVRRWLGVEAETAIAWWDVSPWQIGGRVRLDPLPGLRVHAGLVFPIATWAGRSPANVLTGIREATITAGVTLAP